VSYGKRHWVPAFAGTTGEKASSVTSFRKAK
jgi:hypothetical protein